MPRRSAAPSLTAVRDWTASSDPAALQFMRDDLRRSGLVPGDMRVEPCEHSSFPGAPAYVIHYDDTGYWRVRLKLPPEVEAAKGKYRGPHKEVSHMRAYVPYRLLPAAVRRADVKYICEGEKKAEKLFKDLEVPTVAIAGCWSWSARAQDGSRVLLPDLQAMLKPEDTVFYVADRDILNPKKLDIGKAAKALQTRLASLNVKCTVLVPPDPFKGVDDWLVGGDGPFVLGDLEEFSFSWFPVAALIDEGVSFKPDKDGNITSHKQAISDVRNTSLLASLVLRGDPFISFDKYIGYQVEDRFLGAQQACVELEIAVNQFFPGFSPKKDGIAQALDKHADSLRHTNIIAEYIAALKWDGKRRLDDWLPRAMRLADGADPGYAARVGKALICGLYQRATGPGSQCDFMWILHGPQGIGKTTFFRTLGRFPGHDGYTSIAASDLTRSDYTVGRILKRAVVLDVDDLESVRGKAHGDVKSFVSRTKDVWREIYVSAITEEPRGCIITGSTNDNLLLTDLTGARRFLIISVADIRGVKGFGQWSMQLRDLLLAEARDRWEELKDAWWDIPIPEINAQNRAFTVSQPITDAIKEMWDNGLLLEWRDMKVVNSTAVARYMDDPKWGSSIAVGMAMNKLVGSQLSAVRLGEKFKVRVDQQFFDTMPRQVRALYRPAHDVSMMWVYPVTVVG